MFRAKRKETKWKRLNTIAELLTPPHNVGDETKARALIVDYLYDFYDGLERFKFPEERKDLVFRMSPKPFFASKESTSPEKVTSVLVLLYNSSEYGNFIDIEIFWDYSFLTKLSPERWDYSPGLDDV